MPYQLTNLIFLESRLADRYENSPFWTTEEARLAINEGLRMWNVLTGYWKKRVVIPTTSNTVWYAMPSGMLYPIRFDCGNTPMVQDSLEDMDLGRSNWEGETTASGSGVPGVVTLWMPAGTTLFSVWPADAVGGKQLSMDGIALAPQLVAGADMIDLGEEEQGVLLGYALHVLTFKLGGDVFQAHLPLYQAFLEHAALRNTRLKQVKAFRDLLDKATSRDSTAGPAGAVVG